jgi:hypothetical protein
VTQPLSKAELLELPPVINLATLGRALGLSEPVVRERARRDEFAALGIRVLQLGAQYRVPTADVLQFLGIESPQPRPRTDGRRTASAANARHRTQQQT